MAILLRDHHHALMWKQQQGLDEIWVRPALPFEAEYACDDSKDIKKAYVIQHQAFVGWITEWRHSHTSCLSEWSYIEHPLFTSRHPTSKLRPVAEYLFNGPWVMGQCLYGCWKWERSYQSLVDFSQPARQLMLMDHEEVDRAKTICVLDQLNSLLIEPVEHDITWETAARWWSIMRKANPGVSAIS